MAWRASCRGAVATASLLGFPTEGAATGRERCDERGCVADGKWRRRPAALIGSGGSARELRVGRVRASGLALASRARPRNHGGVPRARVLVPMLSAIAVAGGGLAAGGAGGAKAPESGVRGLVVLAPRCPVILERDPCPEPPRSVSIVIRRAHDRRWVATIRTDLRGRFRKALEPGSYVLQAMRPRRGAANRTAARLVRIPPHMFVSVILR